MLAVLMCGFVCVVFGYILLNYIALRVLMFDQDWEPPLCFFAHAILVLNE